MKKKRKFYTDQDLIDEIKRVSKILGKTWFSRTEFEKHTTVGITTYKRRLGCWERCMKKAGYEKPKPRLVDTLKDRRFLSFRTMLNVLKYDKHKCCLCDRSPATHQDCLLHIDHKIPLCKGGTNRITNLWTLCDKCNMKKGRDSDDLNIQVQAYKHKLIMRNYNNTKSGRTKSHNPFKDHKIPNRCVCVTDKVIVDYEP